MSDCIFCKLANGIIPTTFVYEDEHVAAFKDIDPVAPVHVLIVPKRHFATTLDLGDQAPEIAGRLIAAASAVARKLGVDTSGFRLILNTNADGGQEVFHVHMHLLAGEPIGPLRAKR